MALRRQITFNDSVTTVSNRLKDHSTYYDFKITHMWSSNLIYMYIAKNHINVDTKTVIHM